MLQLGLTAVVLYAFWLLLSGIYTPFLLTMGALVSVAVVGLAHRMNVVDREGHPYHLGWSAATYWPWLIKEILKSAWQVSRVIVDPRGRPSPTLTRFRPRQKTVVGLVTHANSITLTPGTLSVDVGRDEIVVHAFTREGAASVHDSEMDRRVERFEGKG